MLGAQYPFQSTSGNIYGGITRLCHPYYTRTYIICSQNFIQHATYIYTSLSHCNYVHIHVTPWSIYPLINKNIVWLCMCLLMLSMFYFVVPVQLKQSVYTVKEGGSLDVTLEALVDHDFNFTVELNISDGTAKRMCTT